MTEPPVMAVAAKLAAPKPIVPRHEFDFEQATPLAMDPAIYHALQTFRAESLNQAKEILDLVQAEIDAREARELAKRREDDARAERRRRYIVPIITALGIAITGIVAAVVHGCS